MFLFVLIRHIAMTHTDLNIMFFETKQFFKFDYHISFNATLHKHFVVQDERALLRVNQVLWKYSSLSNMLHLLHVAK